MQPPGGPVIYTGNVTGLTEGAHGFHIHEFGDLSKDCESIGEHFNPAYTQHGGPADPYRHVGDLGNIQANADGLAKIADSDHLISLTGPNSVIGRALVITANKDDYGRGGDKESLRTGNSGAKVACGVIVWAKPPLPKPPQGEPPKPEGEADTEVVEP
nr:superoxide dismutase [Cu-Zn] [Halyomorpha halys]